MANEDTDLWSGWTAYGTFGTNIDGSIDWQDNGRGRWGADTRDPTTLGVALPESTIRQYIGDPDDPKTKEIINSGVYQVEASLANGAKSTFGIVDMGPAEHLHRGIDFTGPAAKELGLTDDTGMVHFRLFRRPDTEEVAQQTTGVQERLSGQPQQQATPVVQPKAVSPIDAMRASDPSLAGFSDKQIADRIAGFYPMVPKDQIEDFAGLTNGFDLIQRANYLYETPLARAREKDPSLAGVSDDEAVSRLYDRFGDKNKESLAQFSLWMNPRDPAKTAKGNAFQQMWESTKNFAGEIGRQLGPSSQVTALTIMKGGHQAELYGAPKDVNSALDLLYGQQDEQTRKQLIDQLKSADPAAKLQIYKNALVQGGAPITQKLAQMGINPSELFDRLDSGLDALSKQKDIEESIAWMNKTIEKLDQDTPGTLPENQEKVAKLIAQAPSQALLSLFPGAREFGYYSMLYGSNVDAIKAANPKMSNEEVDNRARVATDAQFPAQEVLGFMLHNGGGAITASITNKVLKAGADVALSSGAGAATFASNQAIQNAAANKALMDGVPEAAGQGAILGGVAAGTLRAPEVGTRMSVKLIQNYMTKSDAGKVVAGYMDHIAGAEPSEINKFLKGDKDNAIDKATQQRAKDVLLSNLESITNPSKPVAEEIQLANEATAAGKHEEAAEHAETAFSLLSKPQQKQVHDGVINSMKGLSETHAKPIPASEAPLSDLYLYPTQEAPEMTKQRSEERRLLSGRLTEEQMVEKSQFRARQFRLEQEKAQAQQRAAEKSFLSPESFREKSPMRPEQIDQMRSFYNEVIRKSIDC
jgi:hypothetical protein